MRVHVADHPLITHKLTVLRDERTPSPVFRALTEELVTLLAYEATRNVRTTEVTVRTPVSEAVGLSIAAPRPLVVPILRAGLGMLEGMVKLVPTAEVGFLGMVRDEETLQPTTYAERLPDDLSNRQCFILDPMLATGGSLGAAIEFLFERGAVDVTAVCLIAAPEGIEAVRKMTEGREVTVVVGALDEKLNERGYIVPGLGDAGDRLYGLVCIFLRRGCSSCAAAVLLAPR
jgi:uracil phosphoribosyltransferase